jgi:hypothetical protein
VAEQEEQQEHSIKADLSNLSQHLLTTKRNNQSATHQEGETLFDCMATLPRMEWAFHHSAEAMPVSASSPPGTQQHLLTQQPANQTQPMAPSLPAISSTVTSPADNQLRQQAHQHLAASPHSGPWTNPRTNRRTCNHGIHAAATITTVRLPRLQ